MTPTLQVEFISSDAGFAALRDDWNRLSADDPLASWEWRHAWWRALGRGRLHIGVVRREGRIVAIAPWFVVRRFLKGPTLEFLGSGKVCTDYQRILLDPELSPNDVASVIRALTRSLPGTIDLDGVTMNEPSIAGLCSELCAAGWDLRLEPLESCWVVDLPATWEAFAASMPRGVRRKINKAGRRADDPDVQFHTATTREEVETIWPEFVRLHELRFQAKLAEGGCFRDPKYARFLREAVCGLAERGLVKLMWCEVLGRAVSAQLLLLSGDTVSMYQSGFDPAYSHLEPGHLLYAHVFRTAIKEGYKQFDFLRGNESYKADWNARSVPLARLIAVAPRAIPRCRHGLWRFARETRRNWRNRRNASPPPSAQVPQGTTTGVNAPSEVEV